MNQAVPGMFGGGGPARPQPAPRRDGRDRQPTVLRAHDDEHRQQGARRHLHRPAPRRPLLAADAAREALEQPDLLHRRDQRPDGDARPGAHPPGPDGPPRLVPHPDEGRPPRHLRPLPGEGLARRGPRHREAARRARPRHERLLAGDDRAGLLDGADVRPPRPAARIQLGRHRRGDDHCGVRDRHRDRLRPRRDARRRDPRGRTRRSRARLHGGHRVDAALYPPPRRGARPPSGAREGGALQLVAFRRAGAARVGARGDGRGARVLRPELDRRRRRRPERDGSCGVDGRGLRYGTRGAGAQRPQRTAR